MAVRLRLRSFAVPCPESPLQRSSRPSMPRVEIRCTRWTCPIGCLYARRVARARYSRVSLPNCPWEQSFEKKNPGLSETSLTCRDKSCILECKQRVQVEVRVYRISQVCNPRAPVRHRSPTRSQPVRGHRHSRTSVYRWSRIGRVARPHINMRATTEGAEILRSDNSLPRRAIALGHSLRPCAGSRKHRRPRLSMVENRSRRAPAPSIGYRIPKAAKVR